MSSSPEWEALGEARERSSVLGYVAVGLLREYPDPSSWTEGPMACAFLRRGGNPDEWEGFRSLLLAEYGCRRSWHGESEHSAVARTSAALVPFDSAAYARSLQEWFAARGEWSYAGGCTGTVRRLNPSPHCSWPTFDERLARGDYLSSRWGQSCCSWDELEGCRWYPRPRCSLRTREVERPACFGLDWDEQELRRVFAQSEDPGAWCLDREGFLRTGRLDCQGCPDRDCLFDLDGIDPSRLEGVA
jgi:hypothetical protein